MIGMTLTLSEVYQCHLVSAIFRFSTQSDENCTDIFDSSLAVLSYDIVNNRAIIIRRSYSHSNAPTLAADINLSYYIWCWLLGNCSRCYPHRATPKSILLQYSRHCISRLYMFDWTNWFPSSSKLALLKITRSLLHPHSGGQSWMRI